MLFHGCFCLQKSNRNELCLSVKFCKYATGKRHRYYQNFNFVTETQQYNGLLCAKYAFVPKEVDIHARANKNALKSHPTITAHAA